MRSQRGVESECKCWNAALWSLVTLLGTLVFVALTLLTRLGECVYVGMRRCVNEGIQEGALNMRERVDGDSLKC